MKWQSGQPAVKGYYLCAIVGNSTPRELYWDGSVWSYLIEYDGWYDVDNNDVPYYMNLSDIPMPEGW